MRQVVSFNAEKNPEKYAPRIRTYERLLMRFYKLIDKDKKLKNEPIYRIVLKNIEQRPQLYEQLMEEERKSKKIGSLNEYKKSSDTIGKIKEVEGMDTLEEISDFVKLQGQEDPRFFYSLSDNLEKERKEVINILSYPPFNQDKVSNLLKLLTVTEKLGAIVHADGDKKFNGKKANDLLLKYYYPFYYYLPFNLRASFDEYITNLDKTIEQEGTRNFIDVMESPSLKEYTQKLKQGTRFANKAHDATRLRDVIDSLVKDDQKLNPDIKINRHVEKRAFYTHVDSISKALHTILNSMLRNTVGTEITLKTELIKINEDNKFYEIQIYDNATNCIDESANRDFIHGKIREVIKKRLNGLCQYYIEANFENNERKCIDMLTGKVSDETTNDNGFMHRLVFKL